MRDSDSCIFRVYNLGCRAGTRCRTGEIRNSCILRLMGTPAALKWPICVLLTCLGRLEPQPSCRAA